MPKRIAFCFDGTWQAPLNNTNVYRLYHGLLQTADQVAYYDDGIGADATGLQRILQGAFGQGLFQKIMDGYTKIAHTWTPGDQIYLFGFSRGAYTARCLAGMIANCGLPSGSFTDDCVTQAFHAYRDPANRASILAGLASCGLAPATIQMIGVWDTVGSLGIPAIFGGVDEKQYGFLDLTLHPNVQHAYHCLAIDEVRDQFPATLWTPLAAGSSQTLEQVWFSGCHGDVGGGVPQGVGVDQATRLCDIPMGYMLSKAIANGLAFDPATIAQFGTLDQEFALDAIHESWKPADGPLHLRPIDPKALVSNSVAIRVQYALTYKPGDLVIHDGQLAAAYTQIPLVSESL